MKRARRINPVKAWAWCPTGKIRPNLVTQWRGAGQHYIRVEIRPVPPRRRASRKA